MRRLASAAGFALALSLVPAAGFAQPRITAPVTDLADAIPAEQEQQVAQKLANHRAASGVAVAVLVVRSTAPLALEDYSMRVATAWRQDLLGATSAVLYVLAVNDRRHRLEVNDVARVRLPDDRSRAVLDAARPALRASDWGTAVRVVMDGVLTALAAPSAPAPTVVEAPAPDPAPTPAPTLAAPRPAAPAAHVPEPTGGEKAFFSFLCVSTVLLIAGIIGAVIVSVMRRVNRAVQSFSGTTYGRVGPSHFHGADNYAHDSSWFASGHDSSSSSFSSSDSSSSSFSSSDSSSSGSGGDFSGGGASSDW
ncbi:MAG: TPM domain-containing protein [Polyangiales bacterium]